MFFGIPNSIRSNTDQNAINVTISHCLSNSTMYNTIGLEPLHYLRRFVRNNRFQFIKRNWYYIRRNFFRTYGVGQISDIKICRKSVLIPFKTTVHVDRAVWYARYYDHGRTHNIYTRYDGCKYSTYPVPGYNCSVLFAGRWWSSCFDHEQWTSPKNAFCFRRTLISANNELVQPSFDEIRDW